MDSLSYLIPEIFLVITLGGLVLSEVGYHGERIRLVSSIALLGLIAALLNTIFLYQFDEAKILSGALVIDGLSLFFKLFFILLCMLTVFNSYFTKEIKDGRRTEYYAFVVASGIAMCLLAGAVDLIVIFLCLQMLGLICYFILGYATERPYSTEAAVKYLFFNLVSTVCFLYATAILFSYTESLNLFEIQRALSIRPLPDEAGLLAFVLLFLSLGFYFGSFPMHQWVVDVLTGAPTPSSQFVALGVPSVGLVVALRFFIVLFSGAPITEAASGQQLSWAEIVALGSGLTMMVGALLALRQKNLKRLLVCMVLSHIGFLLLGLVVLNKEGVSSLLYLLSVDLFALVGVFMSYSFFYDATGNDALHDLKGAAIQRIPEGVLFVCFVGCLIGVPPLPGFIGKFLLLNSAAKTGWFALSIFALISYALLLISFVRVTSLLFNGSHDSPVHSVDSRRRVVLVGILLPLLGLAIFPERVLNWTENSLRFILS